jgi:lauroyl/myristoyl acyltransferase
MKVTESTGRDILRVFIWYPVRWLVRIVPIATAFRIFRRAGDLHFSLGAKAESRVGRNLQKRLDLEASAAAEAVKKSLENHYLDRLHIFLYPRLKSWDRLAPFVRIENREVLDNALLKGKGALLVQPHFGPVQISLLSLALLGYRPLQIGYPTDKGLSWIGRNIAYRLRLRYEGMLPAPIIAADGYLGTVYKHLARGGVVFTTGDGAGGGVYLGEHKKMTFLGTERMVPLGPAAWSVRTGAAYIPTFIVTEQYNRFRIVFGDPIEPQAGNPELDKIAMTERFVGVAESFIRRYPAYWHFWDEIA